MYLHLLEIRGSISWFSDVQVNTVFNFAFGYDRLDFDSGNARNNHCFSGFLTRVSKSGWLSKFQMNILLEKIEAEIITNLDDEFCKEEIWLHLCENVRIWAKQFIGETRLIPFQKCK